MDARITKQDLDFLLSNTHSREIREIQAIHLAAIRARDEALAAFLRRAFRAVGTAAAAIVETLATWPQRRRVYDDLRSLTDRELADIGLSRGEIARVFDPEFAAKTPRQLAAHAPSRRPVVLGGQAHAA
jgi:uncharacterized protein YjiS (DUF1127 family)